MPFPQRWRRLVLTLHVITAVGWLGTDLVLLTLGICGLAGVDPAVVYPAQGLIGLILFTPLSLLVWLVGVVNAIGTRWGLLHHWWVATKLGIVTLMLALVAFALRPNLLAAWHDGATLPHQQRLNLLIAPVVSSSLLVLATVLSTYKPWGRIRARS
jgi:hypothetical protein